MNDIFTVDDDDKQSVATELLQGKQIKTVEFADNERYGKRFDMCFTDGTKIIVFVQYDRLYMQLLS